MKDVHEQLLAHGHAKLQVSLPVDLLVILMSKVHAQQLGKPVLVWICVVHHGCALGVGLTTGKDGTSAFYCDTERACVAQQLVLEAPVAGLHPKGDVVRGRRGEHCNRVRICRKTCSRQWRDGMRDMQKQLQAVAGEKKAEQASEQKNPYHLAGKAES